MREAMLKALENSRKESATAELIRKATSKKETNKETKSVEDDKESATPRVQETPVERNNRIIRNSPKQKKIKNALISLRKQEPADKTIRTLIRMLKVHKKVIVLIEKDYDIHSILLELSRKFKNLKINPSKIKNQKTWELFLID